MELQLDHGYYHELKTREIENDLKERMNVKDNVGQHLPVRWLNFKIEFGSSFREHFDEMINHFEAQGFRPETGGNTNGITTIYFSKKI